MDLVHAQARASLGHTNLLYTFSTIGAMSFLVTCAMHVVNIVSSILSGGGSRNCAPSTQEPSHEYNIDIKGSYFISIPLFCIYFKNTYMSTLAISPTL